MMYFELIASPFLHSNLFYYVTFSKVLKLQAAIKYSEDDVQGAKVKSKTLIMILATRTKLATLPYKHVLLRFFFIFQKNFKMVS